MKKLIQTLASRVRRRRSRGSPGSQATTPSAPATPPPFLDGDAQYAGARKIAVAALHGSLRDFNSLLEGPGPDDAVEALNDYWQLCADIVRATGRGRFELVPGGSYHAVWELGSTPEQAAEATAHAVSCALALRMELERLNESRKVDGKKRLSQAMGMHVGQCLDARVGVVSDGLARRSTGEALGCARALDRLAQAEGKDLVISQEAYKTAKGAFVGKQLGEARLTADTGLTTYLSVVAFAPHVDTKQDSTLETGTLGAGLIVPKPTTVPPDAPGPGPAGQAVLKWVVNNGSQIVGPFTAAELSQRLFTQELDFDCECWREDTGVRSSIGEAGIFSGSQDAGAVYWVYDAGTMHGPLSEGFIRTAWLHKAFGPDAHYCERSAVAGWRKVSELTDRKSDTGSDPQAA